MKVIACLLCSMTMVCFSTFSQERKTKNVIIVTLDGFRWQELFEGADRSIIGNKKYVKDREAAQRFCQEDTEHLRRKTLMPFLWGVVASRGQLYGNRNFKNEVNCKNHHLISYPGYSEMLVGFHDRRVSSNRLVENPNATVLEFIHDHPDFNAQVAAFATWGAFPYILRENISDIYVNSGKDPAIGDISNREKLLNEIQTAAAVRTDSMTFHLAFEYLKRERPRMLFIGFDETDQHAHAGRYDEYLAAANRADTMIGQLWQWIQSQPDYRYQTTLLLTTDHGRGNGPHNWRRHRLLAAGSRHIWFAVLGPDTPAFGEMKFKATTYQNQVAKTVAAFLGLPYQNEAVVGKVVQTMLTLPGKSWDEDVSVNKDADDL